MSKFFCFLSQIFVIIQTLQGIDVKLQQKILDQHNIIRSNTATGNTPNHPGAKNMNGLVWDPALADVAQKYADTCNWAHNSNRKTQFYGSNLHSMHLENEKISVGENLYAFGPASLDETRVLTGITSWYSEHKYWQYGDKFPGVCESGKQCFHYTQMVSAETRYIGCGLAVCNNGLTGWLSSPLTILVCDYWPAGNVVGKSVYERADNANDVGSNCNKDRVSDSESSGLCDGCMSSWGGSCQSGCMPNSADPFCTTECPSKLSNPDQCTDNLGRSIKLENNVNAGKPAVSTTTSSPTAKPTERPTNKPTAKPTEKPTEKPTQKPTEKPTQKPTAKPTNQLIGCCKSIRDTDRLNRYCKALGVSQCSSGRNTDYCYIDSASTC